MNQYLFVRNKGPIFLLLFFALIQSSFAQTFLPGGLIPDDEEYLSVPLADDLERRSPKGSFKSLLPKDDPFPVQNQGVSNGCAGYSIAAAASLRHNCYCDAWCACQKPWVLFSATFIYNLVRDPTTGFASMKRALDTLVSQGICPEAVFPNHLNSVPLADHRQAAKAFKIWEYRRIFRLTKAYANNTDSLRMFRQQVEDNAIAAIDVNRPVLVGMQITPDIIKLSSRNCKWMPPSPLDSAVWHALVLVGYDDRAKEFTLLNSYGSDWGCNGTMQLSYDDFCRVARYGYELRINPPFGKRVKCSE